MTPTNANFKGIINVKNIKNMFESSAFFYEVYMDGIYNLDGEWVGQTWRYKDPLIDEYFKLYAEAFTCGVVEQYITAVEEKERSAKRMNLEIYETAGDEEIVLDISPYLK